MKIVIMGARKRSEAEDEAFVNKVVDELMFKYPQLRLVSAGCDRGVGKIVKANCMPTGDRSNPEFLFVECHTRVYVPRGQEMTQSEFAQIFIARNAELDEHGDEFHLFVEHEPRGMMSDLLSRIRRRGAPYSMYRLGEKEFKPAKVNGG